METNEKGGRKWGTIIITSFMVIAFLGITFFIGLKFSPQDIVNICNETSIDEIPMVNLIFDSWGENLYDSDEDIFKYWIFNYGDKEVKEVYVTCIALDKNDNILSSNTERYGNIASNSVAYGEMITSATRIEEVTLPVMIPLDETDKGYIIGACYIKSCKDCEILHKRIPEFVELYGE